MKEGWESKPLGALSSMISRGVAPKYSDTGDVLVVNQRCIRNHRVDDAFARRHDLTAKTIARERYLQAGDIVINSTGTGTLGRIAQIETSLAPHTTVDSHVTIVRPAPDTFYLPFLRYAFMCIEPALQEAGEGCGGQTELPRKKIAENFYISYPISKKEQQRIVAILDAAFADIARAKVNAEKNLASAKELFEAELNNIFQNESKDWTLLRIEDACESIIDCVNKTAPTVSEATPYRMIRTSNVKNGKILLDKVKYVTHDIYKIWIRRQKPQKGDVILTREAPIGEVGILEDAEGIFLGQRLVSYRVSRGKLINKFLLYSLLSFPMQQQIIKKSSGSTVLHMRVPDSKLLMLHCPDIAIQHRIVARLDALSAHCKQLEALYTQKITLYDELKQSLLQKAFSGGL